MKEHLKLVKRQGYAIDDEENEKGIRCVGAPIYNETGKGVAAVSVSGPAFRVTKKVIQETLKKEVMETALKISRRLGHPGKDVNVRQKAEGNHGDGDSFTGGNGYSPFK